MKLKKIGKGNWTIDYKAYIDTSKITTMEDYEQASVEDINAFMEQQIREEKEAKLQAGYAILKAYYDTAIAILHHTESHEDEIVAQYAARRHTLMKNYYALCGDNKAAKAALEAVQEKANRDWYCEEYLSCDDDDDDEESEDLL